VTLDRQHTQCHVLAIVQSPPEYVAAEREANREYNPPDLAPHPPPTGTQRDTVGEQRGPRAAHPSWSPNDPSSSPYADTHATQREKKSKEPCHPSPLLIHRERES